MGRVSKLMISVLAILAIGFFANTGNADPINVGDVITLQDGPGNTGGGEFKVYKDGVYLFDTFCMERYEYFSFGQPLTVAGISDRAIYGGNPPPGSGFDLLDPRTAYLYTQFRAGTLSNYDYNNSKLRIADANSLQWAIWFIEGEIDSLSDPQASSWVEEATQAAWSGIGNVRVLNLLRFENGQWVRAQDQLVMVPEPSTLLLMGAGLIGVGIFGRKKFKRKERV